MALPAGLRLPQDPDDLLGRMMGLLHDGFPFVTRKPSHPQWPSSEGPNQLILTNRHAIDFDHRGGGGTTEQLRAHDEPGVIIHEGDEIRVTTPETEREDVRLSATNQLKEIDPATAAKAGIK